MGTLNKVMIIGFLGRDPETRSFQNGGQVCNLSVATSEKWRDKQSGESRERTEWHNVALFSEQAIKGASYLRKGSKVYIEGQLETRKWQDQNGQDRYTTEIVVRPYRGELRLMDSAQGNGADGQENGSRRSNGAASNGANGHANGAVAHGGGGYGPTGLGGMNDLNEEIPFANPWR